MLTKLTPEQIANYWNVVKYAIEQSLPPIVGDHPDKLNRILAAALSNKVDVWASYVRKETTTFEGIVLTKLLYDDASDTSNLLIYCIYGYEEISKSSWPEAIKSLIKYAKSKGCSFITAYSDVPVVITNAKRMGADTRYTFLSFNVKDLMEKIDESYK